MQDIFSHIYEIQKEGTPAVLCIVTFTQGSTPRKAGSKMIVFADGHISGTVGGGSVEAQAIVDSRKILDEGVPFKKSYQLEEDLSMRCGGTMEIYFEPIGFMPKLYIFGAGHIGKAVARYACELGFNVKVFDNRPGIFSEWNTNTVQCIEGDYEQSITHAVIDANTFTVIVTHMHLYDEKILGIIAAKQTAYTGMIGSRRKVAETSANLLNAGILTQEQINRVDMPIGIPMAAETPEEIAVSIIAKLIDVKNTLIKK